MSAARRQAYVPFYQPGMICPGCAERHWVIGRFSAECCSCHVALPLAPPERVPAPPERLPAWATRP